MVRTNPVAPPAPPEPPAASRTVEVALPGAAGAAVGCLLLLVPVPVREVTGQAGLLLVSAAGAAVLVAESHRRRRQADAEEHGSSAPRTTSLLRPVMRRMYVVLYGAVVAGLWVLVGSGVPGAAFGAAVGAVYLVALLAVGLSRRRRLAAARADHPSSAVALVTLADLAPMRLTQWAKATRTPLPASLGSGWALVADADGVRLIGASRTARTLPRWGWDDVKIHRGPHPSYPDAPRAAVLVLTLLGPEPAERSRAVPIGRRRFAVTLAVLSGIWPATPATVDADLAQLLAYRPDPTTAGATTGGAA